MPKVSQIVPAACALLLFCNTAFANRTHSTDVKPFSKSRPAIVSFAENKPVTLENTQCDTSFSSQSITTEFPVPNVVLYEPSETESAINKIDRVCNWINTLKQSDLVRLPLWIKHVIGEVDDEIGIAKATVIRKVVHGYIGSDPCSTKSIQQYLIQSHPYPLLFRRYYQNLTKSPNKNNFIK